MLALYEGDKTRSVDRLIFDLWRNRPEHPSTFGHCSEGCGGSVRGSGPCATCIMDAMAEIIGDIHAPRALYDAITAVQAAERKIRTLADR